MVGTVVLLLDLLLRVRQVAVQGSAVHGRHRRAHRDRARVRAGGRGGRSRPDRPASRPSQTGGRPAPPSGPRTVTSHGVSDDERPRRRPRPRRQAPSPRRARDDGPRRADRHDRRRLHRHAGPAHGQARPWPGLPRRRHRPRRALLHVPARHRHGDEHARGLPAHELGDRLRRLDRRADLGPAARPALAAGHGDGPLRHDRRGDRRGDPGLAADDPQAPGRARPPTPASRSRPAPSSSSTSSRTPGSRWPRAAGRSRARSATTTRTTTCSRRPRPSRSTTCCGPR